MQISDSNIMLSKDADLKALCAPLFRNTLYNYFGYFRFYKDNHVVGFSTNSAINKLFYNYELYPNIEELSEVITHMVVLSYDNFHHLPPLELKNNKKLELNMSLAMAHQLCHRIYFIDNKKDYFELHSFGLPEIKVNLKEYLRLTTDILHKFIVYFHVKFVDVINGCYEHRLYLEKKSFIPDKNDDSKSIRDTIDFKKIDKLFKTRHFNLRDILVTKREMQCLESLAKGNSAKQTGINLDLSYRTVESYLDNLKTKLHCNCRSDLIKIFYEEVLSNGFMFNKNVDSETSFM